MEYVNRMENRTINSSRLHRLLVFATVVQTGSMTAAAKVLGIARSGVSAHIRALEDDLGVRLLERTTRQMALTEVGEEVFAAAGRLRDAGEDALRAVDAYQGEARGLLRVACPVDMAPLLVAPVIEQLRRDHPRLRFELHVEDETLDVVGNRIDVALRVGRPVDSSRVMRKIGRTELRVFGAPGRALERPEQLVDLPWLRHTVTDASQWTFVHPDGRQVHVPLSTPAVEVGSSHLLRELVVRGVGFAILPELFVLSEVREGRMVDLLTPWSGTPMDVFVLMPSRSRSLARRVFVDALVAHYARLREQPTEPAGCPED